MVRTLLGIGLVLSLPLAAMAQEPGTNALPGTRLKLPTASTLLSLAPESGQPATGSMLSKPSVPVNAERQSTIRTREKSIGRRILGGSLGAVGGLFGGGYLGAKIEGDSCMCDDPGLKGALIGAPIGAVVGGILGAIFF
jgi:hypothetical protein